MFINATETIGVIMGTGTAATTGSLIISLLLVLILLIAMCILFGIQLEWTAVFILPLLLGYMSYYSDFIAIGSVILIYLSIILTKNFLFK